MKLNPINPNEKKLHKIIHVSGREFRIYIEYDQSLGEAQPNYPDFQATPEYTDEGWPFARSIASGCQYWKPYDSESTFIGGCGSCGWLHLESDDDLIGVCMCDNLRRKADDASETKEENNYVQIRKRQMLPDAGSFRRLHLSPGGNLLQ